MSEAVRDLGIGWAGDAVVITSAGGGLPALLAVVPADALALGCDVVPTAGRWSRGDTDAETEARFTPHFPPVPGTPFVLLTRPDAATPWTELARFSAPGSHPVATARVDVIDPDVADVPANLLRFAIEFSEPMEESSAAGRITLQNAAGEELDGTVLPMPPELWDRDRRRLTVLLEPGRIKRGLQPNVQAGPPLREGEEVTLVVDAGLRSATGAELVEGARRTFRVGPPVRERVDPNRWTVSWPEYPGDPVVVTFDRPLDRLLVRQCLHVVDAHGQWVPGTASVESGSWTFTPEHRQAQTPWTLDVEPRLEDLAGNSVARVFDRDLDLRTDSDGL